MQQTSPPLDERSELAQLDLDSLYYIDSVHEAASRKDGPGWTWRDYRRKAEAIWRFQAIVKKFWPLISKEVEKCLKK